MNRRTFLRGGLVLLAAPAIVRVASIMPVRAAPLEQGWRLVAYEWKPLTPPEVERLMAYVHQEMRKTMCLSEPLA